jgi:peroxiredoxin family protein
LREGHRRLVPPHGQHALLHRRRDGAYVALVQKGAAAAPAASAPVVRDTPQGKTIIVFSGDLDKVLASFIIANGAAAMGRPVTMFFTFWGLTVLRKAEKQPVKKTALMEAMFGAMLPRGSGKLKLSRMNMGGMGTAMMKKIMNDKNVDSLETLIQKAIRQGVKIVACTMSMDVMGIKAGGAHRRRGAGRRGRLSGRRRGVQRQPVHLRFRPAAACPRRPGRLSPSRPAGLAGAPAPAAAPAGALVPVPARRGSCPARGNVHRNSAPDAVHPGRCAFLSGLCLLVVHGGHIADEVYHLVGVAHLVVVPGDDLHEGVGQRDAGLGVEDGGVRGSPRKSEETTSSSV